MPLTDNRSVLGETFSMTQENEETLAEREISGTEINAVLKGLNNYLINGLLKNSAASVINVVCFILKLDVFSLKQLL